MIPFDFEYYRPKTLKEATRIMGDLCAEGKKGLYYSGGTEIVTNFRKGKDKADAVIDIKGIEEMKVLSHENGLYTVGAGLALGEIIEGLSNKALAQVLGGIADHTTRNALTLGGNICGKLPYKEAVLPLLAYEATATIAVDGKTYEKPLGDLFRNTLKLKPAELLVKVSFKEPAGKAYVIRETEGTKIDYPILTVFLLKSQSELFVGLSGFGNLPLVEVFGASDLVDKFSQGDKQSIEEVYEVFAPHARACARASEAYRKHLLKCALEDMAFAMKEEGHHGVK